MKEENNNKQKYSNLISNNNNNNPNTKKNKKVTFNVSKTQTACFSEKIITNKLNIKKDINQKYLELTEQPTEKIQKKDSKEEDEDILKNFDIQTRKRRMNIGKNNEKLDKAFTLVRHQIVEEFSLDKLGKISLAKEHASANRPLNKIKEFTKETRFCSCCNLPCETKGVLEPFSFCEKSDNFSVCGKGIPLYFFYFKYCILCSFVVLCIMSIPILVMNNHFLKGIKIFCNNIEKYNMTLLDNTFHNCHKYIDHNENFIITDIFEWVTKISSDTIIDYREIAKNSTNTYDFIDEIIINYSKMTFICLSTLLIINILCLIMLKIKSSREKDDDELPSDYTLLITNLYKYIALFSKYQDDKQYLLNENNNTENNNDYYLDNTDNEYNNYVNFQKSEIGQFTKYLLDNVFIDNSNNKKYNIFNLNLCFKLNDFMKLQEKCEDCKHKIFQIENDPYQNNKNMRNNYFGNQRRYYFSIFKCLICSDNGTPINELYNEKQNYEQRLKLLLNNAKLTNFSGCAFVTFNTVEEKEDFYRKFPHFFIEYVFFCLLNIKYYLCCCFIKKEEKDKKNLFNNIRVHLAPDPEDVIWENLEFSIFNRVLRAIGIYLASFLLLTISFFIIFLLTNQQNFLNEDEKWMEKKIKKYLVSFSITIVISILNTLLEILLNCLTIVEKQKSMTNLYLSYSIKLTFFTFINSAIVPLISNYSLSGWNTFDNSILLNNILVIFLANSFVTPLVWALNIKYLIKKVQIYFIEKKNNPDLHHHKTQRELNEIYEYPDMQISSKYSYLAKTILMAFFYLPIFPVGIIITFLGLIFGYFLEKYNFIKRYKRPEMLNEKMCEFYFNYFIIFLFVFSLGDYCFIARSFQSQEWAIINLIVFGILTLCPYNKLIIVCFNKYNILKINSKSINKVYFKFYNDYQRQNPFTKKEGLYFYINQLKDKEYISKFIYDIAIKNIEKINVMEIYYRSTLNHSLRLSQKQLASSSKRLIKPISNLKHIIEKKNNENYNNNLIDVENDFEIQKRRRTESSTCSNHKLEFEKEFMDKNNFLVYQYTNKLFLSIGLNAMLNDDKFMNEAKNQILSKSCLEKSNKNSKLDLEGIGEIFGSVSSSNDSRKLLSNSNTITFSENDISANLII